MLRRTLRLLTGTDGPFSMHRPVMAKATRPLHRHPQSAFIRPPTHPNGVNGTAAAQSCVPTHPITPEAPKPNPNSNPNPTNEEPTPKPHVPTAEETDASEDAYRFLLHHIDSEIAALRRRLQTVSTQRESVERQQTRRIHDLFACMERPWLLLLHTPAPQLPNRALEVYAKEQHLRRRGAASERLLDEDTVFLDACRRNWRTMPMAQRKPYEMAARRNEQIRKELKKRMTNGCAHFEKFCEEIKEWTGDMTRAELRDGTVSKKRPKTAPRASLTISTTPSPIEANDLIQTPNGANSGHAARTPNRTPQTSGVKQKGPNRVTRNAKRNQTANKPKKSIAETMPLKATPKTPQRRIANRTHRVRKPQSAKKAAMKIVAKRKKTK